MKSKRASVWKNLALYAGAALVVTVACLALREQPKAEPLGDLEGRFDSQITYPLEDTTAHYREAELTNLLLMGIDRTEGETTGGQADFLLLLTADRQDRTLTLTHIDRDTITQMDIYGIFGDRAGSITTQICLAHAFGATEEQRCENTVNAVSGLFGGIVIEGYIAMDIAGIQGLNDALGGVTVTIEDDFSNEDPSMVPGKTITLTGKQAEIFLRYRSHVADGTNANRMKRQRVYLTAAMELLKEEGQVENLLEAMGSAISTNLTQQELLTCADRWQHYAVGPIQTMEGKHTMDDDGFVAFYEDEEWLETYLLTHFFR